MLDQVFIDVLGPDKHSRVRYQPLQVTWSSYYEVSIQVTLDGEWRQHMRLLVLPVSNCWMSRPWFKDEKIFQRHEKMLRNLQEVMNLFTR